MGLGLRPGIRRGFLADRARPLSRGHGEPYSQEGAVGDMHRGVVQTSHRVCTPSFTLIRLAKHTIVQQTPHAAPRLVGAVKTCVATKPTHVGRPVSLHRDANTTAEHDIPIARDDSRSGITRPPCLAPPICPVVHTAVTVAEACRATVEGEALALAAAWGLLPRDGVSGATRGGEKTRQDWSPLWEAMGMLSVPSVVVGAAAAGGWCLG